MKLLRTALLLLFLPALATAAPAPLPREQRHPEPGGWSKPVDGLRVRLVPRRTYYRVGETVRLMLEIQNVSGSALLVEEPEMFQVTTDPTVKPHGWAITSTKLKENGQADNRRRMQTDEMRPMGKLSRLGSGESLRIEIYAGSGSLLARPVSESIEDRESRQQHLYFSDMNTRGVYDFRATFIRETRQMQLCNEEVWFGKELTSPPVRIELHK